MTLRGAAIAGLWLVSALLAGCEPVIDGDRARVCRIAMAALNPDGARFRIDTARQVAADRIDIAYSTSPSPDAGRQRRLSCIFEPSGARLAALEADGRAVPAAKFWIVTRYWVPRGDDPLPLANDSVGPALPAVLAHGLQHLVSGLPQISIYMLIAAAYALLYGLIRRINLAFGEFAMLSGYGAFLGFSMLGDARGIVAAALAAACIGLYVAALHGAVIGAGIVAPLMRARAQHFLVASVGLAVFLQEYMRLAQGSGVRWISPLLNRPLAIAHAGGFVVTITPMAVLVAILSLAVIAVTLLIMHKSAFGRAWRATADDALAAQMSGIDPKRLVVATVLFASVLAGLAGYVMMVFYGGVGHAGGTLLGLKALLASVLGGIGSVGGAVLGALLLGLAEALWSALFSIEHRDAFIFTLLIVLLVLRPVAADDLTERALHHRAN